MLKVMCSRCTTKYEPGDNESFCPSCLAAMATDAAAAINHQQQIERGNRSCTPANDREKRRLKASIRANLGDSKPDCKAKPKKRDITIWPI